MRRYSDARLGIKGHWFRGFEWKDGTAQCESKKEFWEAHKALAQAERDNRVRPSASPAPTMAEIALRRAFDRHFAGRYVSQARVGKYLADFLFPERNLIVEADGPSHYRASGRYKDLLRSAYLLRSGYKVIRFTNLEILNRLDDVIRQITWALR